MKSGKKKYDYKNFNDLTDDKIFNIDLSWMYNPQLYDEISQMLLLDTIKINNLMNYYLFKPF